MQICEEWVDIKGYEGLYQVSNLGNVKSLTRKCRCILVDGREWERTVNERLLRPSIDRDGYYVVGLSKNNIHKYVRIHRLVLESFCPIHYKDLVVNHKDGNVKNNKLSNLEWVDVQGNIVHKYKTLFYKQHASKRVKCLENNQLFYSANDAMLYYGKKGLDSCAVGRTKSYCQLHWQYVENCGNVYNIDQKQVVNFLIANNALDLSKINLLANLQWICYIQNERIVAVCAFNQLNISNLNDIVFLFVIPNNDEKMIYEQIVDFVIINFTPTKTESQLRKDAMEKYASLFEGESL